MRTATQRYDWSEMERIRLPSPGTGHGSVPAVAKDTGMCCHPQLSIVCRSVA
jgi:hypothetical protein